MSIADNSAWPHLLYVNGAEVDYAAIERTISDYEVYPLGPHCWAVRKIPDRGKLSNQIREAFPKESQKAVFLLAPIARDRFIAEQGGGPFGLYEWLDKR